MNLMRLFAFLFLPLVFTTCTSESEVYLFSYFKNNGEDGLHLAYSFDGFHWKPLKNNQSFLTPTAGKDKLMRDPCIIKGKEGKFYMVWTVSWHEKGIGLASSTDLVHWSEQQFIPVMIHEDSAKNCWAPELFFDEEKDQYLIYWATTIPNRFPETDSLGSSGLNHRLYYVTTPDFKNFSETKLLYDPGFNCIDAVIARVKDQYVMVFKDETLLPKPQKNLHLAFSSDASGPYQKTREAISRSWVEGPTLIKVKNKFLVYFDQYRDQKMGAIQSEDLMHWEDISDRVVFPEGTRHGTVFKVSGTEWNKLKEQIQQEEL